MQAMDDSAACCFTAHDLECIWKEKCNTYNVQTMMTSNKDGSSLNVTTVNAEILAVN